MSYNEMRDMAKNTSLVERYAACYATQPNASAGPLDWAWANSWFLAGSAGWDDAWAYAQATGSPDPGADNGVITDGMILSAVQERLN